MMKSTKSLPSPAPDAIPVPFGYKRITGISQRGDGIWSGDQFIRVKRVRQKWPVITDTDFVIRRAVIEQPLLFPDATHP